MAVWKLMCERVHFVGQVAHSLGSQGGERILSSVSECVPAKGFRELLTRHFMGLLVIKHSHAPFRWHLAVFLNRLRRHFGASRVSSKEGAESTTMAFGLLAIL